MSQQLQELKTRIIGQLDVFAFYQQWTEEFPKKTRNDGWSERVRCPIHNDKKTPNFFINTKTGGFKCHACGASGSAFDFWMTMNGINVKDTSRLKDAIAAVAAFANVHVGEWQASNFSHKKPGRTKRSAPEPYEIPSKPEAELHDEKHDPIPPETINVMKNALTPDHIRFLFRKRGLKREAIERTEIGWDKNWPGLDEKTGSWFRGRIVIPVPNIKGEYRNLRGYSSKVASAFKMGNYLLNKGQANEIGYGVPPRLYNIHLLATGKFKHVVICEGEFDAILGNQELWDAGYSDWLCVSSTHGVKNFMPEWLPHFFGCNVYFCYDADESGKLWAPSIASKFFIPYLSSGKFESLRIVELPIEGTPDDKDVTDFFLKHEENNATTFVDICQATPLTIAGGVENDDATVEATEVDSLVTALKDRRYIDKKVRVPLTISGTTSHVYHAVREFEVIHCPLMEKGECCSQNAGVQVIPYGDPIFIQSCMQKQAANRAAIAAMACSCGQKIRIAIHKKVVMEQFLAHQVVSRWRSDELGESGRSTQELVSTQIYVLQPSETIQVEPRDYFATGYVRTHPNTSLVTIFVENLELIEEDWRRFSLSNKSNYSLIKQLKEEYTTDQILTSITRDVTHVYKADDILLTVLLTFLSPLSFIFNGSLMRGWINSTIIGDSGTGKSDVYISITDWLDMGDLFSSLSGTRTGLLYAVKQAQGEWHISIGRYVHACGTIIAIDEAQEIQKPELKKMAIAMDTGHLKIEQVASGGYKTETRTLFLMNPKDAKGDEATITDFAHGCEALMNCFPFMFIRRLDLACFTMNMHNYSFFNQRNVPAEESGGLSVSASMMRALVFYAWTRTSEQIHWTEEATNECLSLATELSERFGYADKIPLVSPQDFRLNLARISTAFAVLERNFIEDLEVVEILPEHVKAVASFLIQLYSSPACGLLHYSKQSKAKNTLEDFEDISKYMSSVLSDAGSNSMSHYKGSNVFLQMLLIFEKVRSIRKRDLVEQLNSSQRWVQSKLVILIKYNLVEVHSYGYKKTRKFTLFMLEWRRDPEIEKRLEDAFTMPQQHEFTVESSDGMIDIDDQPDYSNVDRDVPVTFDSPFDV